VFFAQIGQGLLKLVSPLRIVARDLLCLWTCLPDAEQPDNIKAHASQTIELGVRNIVERGSTAQLPGQLRQPDASIDLIKCWILRRSHRCSGSMLGTFFQTACDGKSVRPA